jgi:PQQ system protein
MSRTVASLMSLVLIALSALLISGCGMVRLGETMLGTSEPNEKVLGQLFANGLAAKTETDGNGTQQISIETRPMETIWRPAIIVMSQPGTLEIEFHNNDPQKHTMPIVPSDGYQMALDLPPLTSGRMRVHLGSPGMYMFGSGMGDQIGRGMMGMIIVEGEVPQEAKLDRPPQPRP